MSADGRRAMLAEVKRDLSVDDRAALNQYLIGSLSVSVTDDHVGVPRLGVRRAVRKVRGVIYGARRRYWFALAFTVGYSMLLTPFAVRWPL